MKCPNCHKISHTVFTNAIAFYDVFRDEKDKKLHAIYNEWEQTSPKFYCIYCSKEIKNIITE